MTGAGMVLIASSVRQSPPRRLPHRSPGRCPGSCWDGPRQREYKARRRQPRRAGTVLARRSSPLPQSRVHRNPARSRRMPPLARTLSRRGMRHKCEPECGEGAAIRHSPSLRAAAAVASGPGLRAATRRGHPRSRAAAREGRCGGGPEHDVRQAGPCGARAGPSGRAGRSPPTRWAHSPQQQPHRRWSSGGRGRGRGRDLRGAHLSRKALSSLQTAGASPCAMVRRPGVLGSSGSL